MTQKEKNFIKLNKKMLGIFDKIELHPKSMETSLEEKLSRKVQRPNGVTDFPNPDQPESSTFSKKTAERGCSR